MRCTSNARPKGTCEVRMSVNGRPLRRRSNRSAADRAWRIVAEHSGMVATRAYSAHGCRRLGARRDEAAELGQFVVLRKKVVRDPTNLCTLPLVAARTLPCLPARE